MSLLRSELGRGLDGRGRGILPRQREHGGHLLAVFLIQLNACEHPSLPPGALPLLLLPGDPGRNPASPCVEEFGRGQIFKVAWPHSHLADSNGKPLATVEVPIPSDLRENYEALLCTDQYPPCYSIIPQLPSLKVHSWLSALQTERLEQKTNAMVRRVKELDGSWEDGYFATLARNFGFSINGDAFDVWMRNMPMQAVAHHRDDLFQVETLFIGQAGLLDKVDERYAKEYRYLAAKFGLQPMDASVWKYLRTRPQNFAHVRLMQLAKMYHERRTGLSELLACEDVKAIGKLYGIKGTKLNLLIINTAIPTIFAYGRHHAKEQLCERAYNLLESLKPEENRIIRMWQDCGLEVTTAGDSQALIQLKKEYCDKKNCIRCRFGFEFLAKKR